MNVSVSTKKELEEILSKEDEKVVIVKFGADWCAPCQAIAPAYAEVLEEFDPHVVPISAGHDEAEELFEEYEVTGMPTFLLFKNAKVERFLKKPDAQEIRSALKQSCPRPPLVLDENF